MTNLSHTMLDQLYLYAVDWEKRGDYFGNKKQFWKRHEKIMKWLKEQQPKGSEHE